MARSLWSRTRKAALGGALTVLLGLSPGGIAHAATPPRTSTPTSTPDVTALERAFAHERGLPLDAVGAVRPGTLHAATDSSTGTTWAVAGFLPAAGTSARDQLAFQDGADTTLFIRDAGGTWQVEAVHGLPGCSKALSTTVKSALGLTTTDCAAGTARPSAAARARAAQPESVGSTIASIALGQVGIATTPAETSFSSEDCDPYSTMVGAQSPNSDGCGPDQTHAVQDQNEEWCADFSKWVWEQAGVTTDLDTLNAGANSFYAWATAQGENPAADTGTPQPGDAVVFYPAGSITTSSPADHVGLISSVNSDGTVDMVNGDFLGSNGITVQYNENLNLTSWAASTWGSGEQWVLVTPPTTAQSAPTVTITAAHTAAAGTAVSFSATASEPGGSISQYAWTFGDGRTTNASGAQVSHVYARAGLYTVTLTVTSNLGTATTKTWNVGVSASSSSVSSTPNSSVWYTTDPVMQYSFTASTAGVLDVHSWDGVSWLEQAAPGHPAAGSAPSPVASLAYADPDSNYSIVPHAFYRTASGGLGETYLGAPGNGWSTASLPGSPASGSAVAAIAANPDTGTSAGLSVSPSVFFFDASGALNVATEQSGGWTSAAIAGPTTSGAGSLAVAANPGSDAARHAFFLDNAGNVIAVSDLGGGWQSAPIPNSLGVKAGSPLAAATTDAGVDVFFLDAGGKLAVASSAGGSWQVQELAGSPASASALVATNVLGSTGAVLDEVYYVTSSGAPGITAWSGSAWQASTLPGTATSIDGASGNGLQGSSEQLFFADAGQFAVDSATAPGATWSYTALPSTPTAWPGTVLLYAATSADKTTALAVASYAGLPSGQVTTSFASAWAAALSGNYLVIVVGQAAYNALYDNPCGWANPSQEDPGTTPFDYVVRPLNVPLTNLFLVGVASQSSKSAARADDLAYYAVHGSLPSGATLPSIASAGHTCLGSAT